MQNKKHIISFRPWSVGDIPQLARIADNENIGRNLRDGFPHPYTEEDAAAFISMSSAADPVCNYAVLCDGEVAGGIGYVPGVDVHRISAEIGYWLGEEYWGRGTGTEAIRSFSEFVFATTEIIHLHAGIFSFNKASMRAIEKAGYSLVGTMHRCAVKRGELIGLVHYELCKGQIENIRCIDVVNHHVKNVPTP